MTDLVTIVLAGEPVGKGRPRFVRATGRPYTPAHTAKYEGALRYAAQTAMAERAPFEGPVSIDVTAAFPIPASWPKWRKESAMRGEQWATTRPDCDNIVKLCDALNEVVFRDDKQVVKITMAKLYSDHPSLTIIVEPLSEPAREAAHKPARKDADLLASLPLMAAGSAA
jgi:Holliday junction resolvase RusA-like endonuclease